MTLTPEQASRLYFTRMLEIAGGDAVMMKRVARICRDEYGYHYADIAHEADIKAWQAGWRPKKRRCGQGRHNFGDSDLCPRGQVWLHDGIWYTFNRAGERCERLFERRSNPLDHEWQRREEPWVRRIPVVWEKEYS